MIVVDSSALIAILEQEPEAERFLMLIRDADRRVASAVTVYEAGIVIGVRRGWDSISELNALLDLLGIEIVPFSEPQISNALGAYRRFGKGIHPEARLNLGDCVAYALATSMQASLLFKGTDFAATDVQTCT
jgi:ribonuclease VapC